MERVDFSRVSLRDSAAFARRNGLRKALARFRRDEDGSLIIFGLFCFVMMLIMAGISLDLMRNEERRTRNQNTADRAALAAADLNQTLPPKEVVKDYFLKEGLPVPKDEDIIIQQGNYNEWRTVVVNVNDTTPTWFMNMVGVNELPTNATATAEERIGQVEISLVLDVSGSMNSNSRLINLKPAAKQFIDTMFDSIQDGKVSVSIVTYSTQVKIGNELAPYINMTSEHTKSDCIEFTADDYKTTTLDFGFGLGDRVYQRNGHFDPFYRVMSTNESSFLRNCPTQSNRDILAFSGDRVALKAHIDSLVASGNTSIDVGMKWGAALLDPSMSGVVDSLVADHTIPFAFGERPYAYADREALKVIVVMTDGENTTEYRLNTPFASGLSNIYFTPNTGFSGIANYSLYDASRNQYFVYALNTWRNEPYGEGGYNKCNQKGCTWIVDKGDTPVQLTWQQVWNDISLSYFSRYFIEPAYGSTEANKWSPGASNAVNSNKIAVTKDARTLDICDAAKSHKVSVFAIGFEAPSGGRDMLRQCASTPANYYNAAGTNIADAFSAIASSINKLRLTH